MQFILSELGLSVGKLCAKEDRIHFVAAIFGVGIEILHGSSDLLNEPNASPQLFAYLANDGLFGSFAFERAAARQPILLPAFDCGYGMVVCEDYGVSGPPVFIFQVWVVMAER